MAENNSQVFVALMLTLVGGVSTAIGGLLVVLQPVPNIKRLGILQGLAAGLMLTLSFNDLMHNAINAIGFGKANLWFFGGVLFFAGVVYLIPEPTLVPTAATTKKAKAFKGTITSDGKGKDPMKKRRRQALFSGALVGLSIGISLHNFPEGIAVFLGSLKGLRVGISLALAIALHNIPEGVAVALPVYFATESKWQAFLLSALSGLAEPLGVVIVAFLFPSKLSSEVLEGLLAAVGGIMAFLTLHEMMPLALEYAGHRKAISAVFVGMALMALSLQLLEMTLPHDMG